MARIAYEDKVSTRESSLPRKNSITAEDLIEIKESVNALYDEIEDGGFEVQVNKQDS